MADAADQIGERSVLPDAVDGVILEQLIEVQCLVFGQLEAPLLQIGGLQLQRSGEAGKLVNSFTLERQDGAVAEAVIAALDLERLPDLRELFRFDPFELQIQLQQIELPVDAGAAGEARRLASGLLETPAVVDGACCCRRGSFRR